MMPDMHVRNEFGPLSGLPPQLQSAETLERSIMAVISQWAEMRSKDPSSKVGAAVYDRSTGAMFLGYNGFAQGMPDFEEVWRNTEPANGITKYELVVHAETNALFKALQSGADLSKCSLYCTHQPCPDCMRSVVAPSGIKVVVYACDEYRSLTTRGREICRYIAEACDITLRKVKS